MVLEKCHRVLGGFGPGIEVGSTAPSAGGRSADGKLARCASAASGAAYEADCNVK